jgi:GNAT superfamily N-acetyltransferase
MRTGINVEFHPLTPDRWNAFEALFGERGACYGCWCMYWRLPSSVWSRNTKEQNKQGIKAIVESGPPPGLLAYVGDEAVGWVSLGPPEAFPHIERSRTLKRLDGKPTWSVNCFFIAKPYRNSGLMLSLLQAGIEYARSRGARLIEGYPVEPRGERVGTMDGFVGIASIFRKAGFRKVRRRVEGTVISRYQLAA